MTLVSELLKVPSEWTVFIEMVKPQLIKESKKYEALVLATEVYPSQSQIFKMFCELKPNDITVLIIGQDPYPIPDVANGIGFSTSKGNPIPASLRNIYCELEAEGFTPSPTKDNYYYLDGWIKQGVFLTNSSLTVDKLCNSHETLWIDFIVNLCKFIASINPQVVVVLLGKKATSLKKIFDIKNVFYTSHPAPGGFTYGFSGSGIFKKVNDRLTELGKQPIDW